MRVTVFAIVALASGLAAGPQDQRDAFLETLRKTYGFTVSEISKEDRERKTKELDAFWELVGSDLKTYFDLAHFLAVKGADVTAAVERILDRPAFEIYLVDHAITLKKETCVLYCLLPRGSPPRAPRGLRSDQGDAAAPRRAGKG
jgi:hypothetical protein